MLAMVSALMLQTVSSFIVPTRCNTRMRQRAKEHWPVRMTDNLDQIRDDVSAMRVKQIKAELDALGAKHSDAVEKEDLVQRLIDARAQQPSDVDNSALTMDQIMQGTEMFMADADGPAMLEDLQKNPRVMAAMSDIAANGDASKYQDDAEVMEFMRKLEQITKRGMNA